MFSIGGASVGLQVGGSTTDFVLLLMNPKVVNQVLSYALRSTCPDFGDS
jgi:lipid-binding SYLF domain-containing protein